MHDLNHYDNSLSFYIKNNCMILARSERVKLVRVEAIIWDVRNSLIMMDWSNVPLTRWKSDLIQKLKIIVLRQCVLSCIDFKF